MFTYTGNDIGSVENSGVSCALESKEGDAVSDSKPPADVPRFDFDAVDVVVSQYCILAEFVAKLSLDDETKAKILKSVWSSADNTIVATRYGVDFKASDAKRYVGSPSNID